MFLFSFIIIIIIIIIVIIIIIGRRNQYVFIFGVFSPQKKKFILTWWLPVRIVNVRFGGQLIFCPKIPVSELFSKTTFKSSRDSYFFEKFAKIWKRG